MAVIAERLKRKFGAAIVTHTPKVPYRETIRGKTQVEGKYKKQTGGHGMFGHVWIEIEPNPGGGVEFGERVVGGSVPKGFFPGVEKGIREAAAEGVLAGYPLSRLQGDPLRRLVPHRSTRTSCRSRSPRRWPSRRASWSAGRPCSSRSWRSRSPSPSATWATSTATSTPAAAGSSAWTLTATDAGRLGPRAPGRAVHLRDRAALADPRPGHVHGRRRPLRGSPVTSPRRSSGPISARPRQLTRHCRRLPGAPATRFFRSTSRGGGTEDSAAVRGYRRLTRRELCSAPGRRPVPGPESDPNGPWHHRGW